MTVNMTILYIVIGMALVANFVLIIGIMKRRSSNGKQPTKEPYEKLRQENNESFDNDAKTTSLSDQHMERGAAHAAAAIEEKTEVLHPISNLTTEEKNKLQKAPVSDATMILNQPSVTDPVPTRRIIEYRAGTKTEQYAWSNQDVVRIGRDGDLSDLVVLSDGYVGRTHALLYEKDHKIFLVDLASKNGTFIDSVAVKGQQEIKRNQFFKIGQTEMVVK